MEQNVARCVERMDLRSGKFRGTIMECKINARAERRCSTCAFEAFDEDQVPCLPCFESEILYNQWVQDPDCILNLINKMTMQDKGDE